MTSPNEPRRGVLKRLYHGETKADIVGRWKLWFAISGVLLLIGAGALLGPGLKLGIDFTGGTVWQVEAGDAEVADVQDAMAELGYQDVQVQEVTQASGGSDTRFFRVEAEDDAEPAEASVRALDRASDDLADLRGDVPADVRGRVDDVRDTLDGIDGPFEQAVPAPLEALQAEIDGVPATLEEAKDDPAAVRRAADRMLAHITDLSNLEDEERTRLGADVTDALAELTGTPATDITVDTVGPSWGQQISEKARNALVVFMIAITIFITIRFELKMALATVVALLTMLGFSIYDGIVVFDRVNENTKLLNAKSKMTYTDMANMSLNQVLMRSLNTSITSLLPILSVLIIGAVVLGASTLEEFGVALFLGLLSGAYSSIFIATPLLALLKEREPQYRELRTQIAERGHGTVPLKADVVPTEAELDPVMASVKAGPTAPRPPGGTPRPRKQGRKR